MPTDIGEYLVGAYLRLVERCDFVNYNVRTFNGGLDGLHELDVLGINLQTHVAYLCEVTTHICGLQYGRNNTETLSRVRAKCEWQQTFAAQYLRNFTTIHRQFWSPVVPVGNLTEGLALMEREGLLEAVINGEYKRRVEQLQRLAQEEERNT